MVNGGSGSGWHKPKTWGELQKLVEGYQGCTDYDIGDVPRIVVDTTDPTADAEEIAGKMASCGLKPRAPVILRELEPSSEMFKQGASLQSYDVDSATAVIQDNNVRLKVDTQHLMDISFRMNSMY
ncbi:hypothetical protein PR202_ga28316 [Eleusine coracana subsp. coracana]|uniref:Uncharacterized protein n=1 Tax=Eleusine coracana subsp. coracana TaxID=191504 RepID=A0AAV5DIX7_ELECO|nr:hypothetical protein PR202_ga28316 [Eleusine coracana subsp. coracana]